MQIQGTTNGARISRFLAFINRNFPKYFYCTVPILRNSSRQAQTSAMAIQSATETLTPDTMGDPVSSLDAG